MSKVCLVTGSASGLGRDKAEQKAEDTQHALNLLLNFGFERFHMALISDGAVHSFELEIVRNLSAPDEIDLPHCPGMPGALRIVLWRTAFPKDTFAPQHSLPRLSVTA